MRNRHPSGTRTGFRDTAINMSLSLATVVLLLAGVEIAFRVTGIRAAYPGIAGLVRAAESAAAGAEGRGAASGAPPARPSEEEAEYIEKTLRETEVPAGVNRLGFWDIEHPAWKPEGVCRIAFAGDSFMRGDGVAFINTFPNRFRWAVERRYPGLQVEAVNYGMSGADNRNNAAILLYEAPAAHPDLVVWGFVLNDAGGPDDVYGERAFYDGIRFKADRFESLLKRHSLFGLRKYWRTYDYAAARYENRMITRMTVGAYADAYDPVRNVEGLSRMESEFRRVAGFYAARGVPVVLFIYPLLVELDGRYPFADAHREVARAGRRAGLNVVDTLPAFLGREPASLWVSALDQHPNAAGQKLAADAVAAFVADKQLIRAGGEAAGPTAPPEGNEKERLVAEAKTLVSRRDYDRALEKLSPVLEWFPDETEAQWLAASVFEKEDMRQALGPKLARLRLAPPPWPERAGRLEGAAESRR